MKVNGVELLVGDQVMVANVDEPCRVEFVWHSRNLVRVRLSKPWLGCRKGDRVWVGSEDVKQIVGPDLEERQQRIEVETLAKLASRWLP